MLGTRNYPVVIGGGIAVLLFSLVGAAAITGALPSASERKAAAAEQAAKPTACRNCGVVAAIRPPASKHRPYRVVLRMEDGSERIVSQAAEPDFGVGARVRLVGRTLERG
jgi:hypothetical protein